MPLQRFGERGRLATCRSAGLLPLSLQLLHPLAQARLVGVFGRPGFL
jgi:hypothetical protein